MKANEEIISVEESIRLDIIAPMMPNFIRIKGRKDQIDVADLSDTAVDQIAEKMESLFLRHVARRQDARKEKKK